jgi:hypothetical protein
MSLNLKLQSRAPDLEVLDIHNQRFWTVSASSSLRTSNTSSGRPKTNPGRPTDLLEVLQGVQGVHKPTARLPDENCVCTCVRDVTPRLQ